MLICSAGVDGFDTLATPVPQARSVRVYGALLVAMLVVW